MKKFSVVVTWSAGYFGSRQYTLHAESLVEAKKQSIELAWSEIKDNKMTKASSLRISHLSAYGKELLA